MSQAKLGRHTIDKIEIESAEKRLAEDLKRALENKSSRHGNAPKRERPAKGSKHGGAH